MSKWGIFWCPVKKKKVGPPALSVEHPSTPLGVRAWKRETETKTEKRETETKTEKRETETETKTETKRVEHADGEKKKKLSRRLLLTSKEPVTGSFMRRFSFSRGVGLPWSVAVDYVLEGNL